MLIIPFDRKLDWKNPPLITLLLLLINILVFVAFQLDDDVQLAEAVDYYHTSGLDKLERPYYQTYLQKAAEEGRFGTLSSADIENDSADLMWSIQTDARFLKRLEAGLEITPATDDYAQWRKQRELFTEKFEAITFVGYGLRTAKPSPTTLVSHMFLHGGFWHLFGNGLFLLAVGFLVELTLGRWIYLVCYLMGGLGSASFDFIFNSGSLIPGIGASGAIAGLMGMYAVAYGMRRIQFFYSIGVYFDIVRLPAIVLLPLWLGNEVTQIVLYSATSNINYLAHIGGLISGAVVAYILKQTSGLFDLEFLDKEEQASRFEARLAEARHLFERMEYRQALARLRGLLREHPEHREILCLSHQCSRIAPESEEYHRLSRTIFSLPDGDIATLRLIEETFNEYLRLARPSPRLNATVICRLAKRFIHGKCTESAEKLLGLILRKDLSCPELSRMLLAYADLLDEQGRSAQASGFRQRGASLSAAATSDTAPKRN